MRTQEEIQEEIRRLKALEPVIRSRSAFGNDNRATLRAELKVLEDNLSEDQIYDLEDLLGYDTISNMMRVRDWLDGEEEEGTPSEGWLSLAPKGWKFPESEEEQE